MEKETREHKDRLKLMLRGINQPTKHSETIDKLNSIYQINEMIMKIKEQEKRRGLYIALISSSISATVGAVIGFVLSKFL